MQASPSPQFCQCYGFNAAVAVPLLHVLHLIFPVLSRALTKSPWAAMADPDKFDALSHTEDLQVCDADNDDSLSSDEEDSDNAITSYDGSPPASPIESFGNPLPSPAVTHPDHSQFSTVVSVGTPNIIHTVQSRVTASPSTIRDVCLTATPYSMLLLKPSLGSSSRHSSAPSTCPPSCGPPLPTMAADFGLKPSTATPLSYVPEMPAAPAIQPAAAPTTLQKSYPFLEKVSVGDPDVMPTIAGIVPHEWAVFKKHILDYNLLLDLYKTDLDWKKLHLHEPTDPDELAAYHLNIGRVNQRVGVIALMEQVIGQYINTVGATLVEQQTKIDNLKLTKDDINGTWHKALKIQDESCQMKISCRKILPCPCSSSLGLNILWSSVCS